MEIKSKQVRMDKEMAYRLIDCRKDSPLYDEMETLYDEIWFEMKNLIKSWGRIGFASYAQIFGDEERGSSSIDSLANDSFACKKAVESEAVVDVEYAMVLYTLGVEINDYIDSLFAKGEYLKATLANAMADSCLFAMEEEWKPVLKSMCEHRKCGITKRMEAPADFPIEFHKKIWELLDGENSDVTLTSGYMFSPVKTCCTLFLLSENCDCFQMDHDCKLCLNQKCMLRKER